MKIALVILLLALFGYAAYESNAFFLSGTERVIVEKVSAMGIDN